MPSLLSEVHAVLRPADNRCLPRCQRRIGNDVSSPHEVRLVTGVGQPTRVADLVRGPRLNSAIPHHRGKSSRVLLQVRLSGIAAYQEQTEDRGQGRDAQRQSRVALRLLEFLDREIWPQLG